MDTSTVKTIPPMETTAVNAPDGPRASDDEIRAAEYYQGIFVPALFAHWSPLTVEAAGVRGGDRVLDVACGTGTATALAADAAGAAGEAVGIDIAPGMLAVAARQYPELRWRHGDMMRLPFADGAFDRVLCQFGLMFAADPVAVIGEMRRVLRPGGRFALTVWNSLEHNPGFADKVAILEQLAGDIAAAALRAPFAMGDGARLRRLAGEAGATALELASLPGEAAFDGIDEFVDAELRGWLPVMGVHLDEGLIERIRARCRQQLQDYVGNEDARLRMPTSAHVLAGSR